MAASSHRFSLLTKLSGNPFNFGNTKFVSSYFQSSTLSTCRYSTQSVNEEELDEELERKRDKSRLKPWIRKEMEGNEMPAIIFDFQTTVKYKRKLYAKFGRASGLNPSVMWPSAEELESKMEMDNELEPKLVEMLENVEKKKREEEQKIKDREMTVANQMAKLDTWMKELQQRKTKKIAEVKAIREKKERLVEEVRQYFGYKLSPKDPKFQEVLEMKEKEERKAEKEAKKKERTAREMARLAAMAQQSIDDAKGKGSVSSDSSSSPRKKQ